MPFDIDLCNLRRKRDLGSVDDSADDQDDIPPFEPPIQNTTFAPAWPTPKGLSRENVTNFCKRRLRYSKTGETCGSVPEVNMDVLIQQCILDIQVRIIKYYIHELVIRPRLPKKCNVLPIDRKRIVQIIPFLFRSKM